MPYLFHFECDSCGTVQPNPADRRYLYPVYLLDRESTYAPLLASSRWCSGCNRISRVERIPSDAEINGYVLDARKHLKNHSNSDEAIDQSLNEFYRIVLTAEVEWRALAAARRNGLVRCLECGRAMNQSSDDIVHEGCGGRFVATQSEIHVLPKTPDKIDLELYGVNGCRYDGKSQQIGGGGERAKDVSLQRNPFWVLRVTTRDNKRRIVEVAQERALAVDPELCDKARSELINPRSRLAVELAWLPGLSPKRCEQLMTVLEQNPSQLTSEVGLPPMAGANLLAACLESGCQMADEKSHSRLLLAVAEQADHIVPDNLLRVINEDRAVAGFPEVLAGEQYETQLADRLREIRGAMKESLDRLPSESIATVMRLTVIDATAGGCRHAARLIDELVDNYEVESQGFLQKEAANVLKLVVAVAELAERDKRYLHNYLDKLESVSRNWDRVAYPIKLAAKARGTSHPQSKEIAEAIRGLSVALYNKHQLTDQSKRLVRLLEELFADVPEIAERVGEDAATLHEIGEQERRTKEQIAEWNAKITYSAELGLVFKDQLSISPSGVSYKHTSYPLSQITRVRWGAVRHSINGIPSGTTYTIAFGDSRSETVVQLNKERVFSEFIDRLWTAVCVRLITQLLEALKKDGEFRFSTFTLKDDGAVLIKHNFLSSNGLVFCPWRDTHVWSADGSFYIGSKTDKKTYVAMSYINDNNTPIVEQAIRAAFKKPGLTRLSELLNG